MKKVRTDPDALPVAPPRVAAGAVALAADRERAALALRPAAVSMNLVKVPVSQADSVLSQAEATGGIIALHVTQPQHFLSNNLVARSAATFASSMLYGGPTCSVIELSIEDGDPDGADALEMCQEKGLTNPLPCVMLFSSDRPVQQCALQS